MDPLAENVTAPESVSPPEQVAPEATNGDVKKRIRRSRSELLEAATQELNDKVHEVNRRRMEAGIEDGLIASIVMRPAGGETISESKIAEMDAAAQQGQAGTAAPSAGTLGEAESQEKDRNTQTAPPDPSLSFGPKLAAALKQMAKENDGADIHIHVMEVPDGPAPPQYNQALGCSDGRWDHCSPDQKLERMREIVRSLATQVDDIERLISAVRSVSAYHSHAADGQILVPAHELLEATVRAQRRARFDSQYF